MATRILTGHLLFQDINPYAEVNREIDTIILRGEAVKAFATYGHQGCFWRTEPDPTAKKRVRRFEVRPEDIEEVLLTRKGGHRLGRAAGWRIDYVEAKVPVARAGVEP